MRELIFLFIFLFCKQVGVLVHVENSRFRELKTAVTDKVKYFKHFLTKDTCLCWLYWLVHMHLLWSMVQNRKS